MVGGTLDDIGLSHLIQTYCGSRQAARIKLTYPDAEGELFFDQGDLVDAELGSLTGIGAVHAALAKKGGRFNVDLGLRPSRRTITQHWSSVLIGIQREEVVRARPATPLAAPQPSQASGTASSPGPGVPKPPARPEPPKPPARPEASKPPARTEARSISQSGPGMTDSTNDTNPRLHAPPVRPPRTAAPQRPGISARISRRLAEVTAAGVAIVLVTAAVVGYRKRSSDTSVPAVVSKAPLSKDSVITLGMSAALTGPAKELGRQMKLGVETSLKVVNDAGGINGYKFELVALDDGYEPDRTKEAMKELVERRKVFAIVGNVGTPTAEVSVPYILQKKVLFFGAFTGAGLLRKEPPDRYVFNYRAGYLEETAAVVRYLVETRKVKPNQIAVFAQQDGFGEAGFAGVTRALRKYGRDRDQILRVGFKRNTLDVGEAVGEVLKKRDQIRAIVMVAPYRPAAKFIEKVKEQGVDTVFTNVSFVGSTALAEELHQLGPKYSDGVIVTQVVPPVDSLATAVIQYREALQRYFPGEKQDFVSLEGYLATEVLMEGFRRTGKNPTTESLIDALEGIRGLDLGIGTPISYGLSEHQGSHKVWGTVLDQAADYHVFDLE